MKIEAAQRTATSLITVDEAAMLLGVKRQTIYLWVRQGSLPFYRVGKRLIKFDTQELLSCFKVERSMTAPQSQKIEVGERSLAEPFRALEKTESPQAKEQKERYRAMLGVVK
jgi:excisionase family DNA binding protein